MQCRTLGWLLVMLAVIAQSSWGAPQVNGVSQAGLKIGETTLLYIDGAEFSTDSTLQTTLPLRSQVVKDATPARIGFEIVVDEAAQPGVYAIRVATTTGISNPILVGVDRLPQQPWSETGASLPVALFGNLNGSEVRRTTFAAVANQVVTIDIEAQRLGSNFKPVLRLYDSRGRQVASGIPQPWFGGDTRIVFKAPADGVYTLELNDRVYRAGAPNRFRLKIGELSVANRVFPSSSALGTPTKLTFLGGTIPATATADFLQEGKTPGDYPVRWPEGLLVTGPQPAEILSEFPSTIEVSAAGAVQEIASANHAVNGLLSQPREEDRFAFAVTPGQKLRVEMQARSIGSPIDGVLNLRNEQGGVLANADDVPGSLDPLVNEYVVLADMKKLVVAVKDLHGRGGIDFNYRIVVRDLASPDFKLSLAADRLLLPAGGTQIIPITVERIGYAGPITLQLVGLPGNLVVQGGEIPAGVSSSLLAIQAPADAKGAGLIRIVGRSTNEAGNIARTMRGPAYAGTQSAAYLRDEISWGVTTPLPIALRWNVSSATAVQGVPVAATLAIDRGANVQGAVRLRLFTTQAPVKKKFKENNVDREVDDLDRMLRLQMDTTIAADQKESPANVFVPADLPVGTWDTAIVGELLAADGTTVVSTAYSSLQRFTIQPAPTPAAAAAQ